MAWGHVLIVSVIFTKSMELGADVTIENLQDRLHGIESFNELYTNEIRATVKSYIETIHNITVKMMKCTVSGIDNQFEITGNHELDKPSELAALDPMLVHLQNETIVNIHNSSDKDETVDCSNLHSRNKDILTFGDLNMLIFILRESVDNMANIYRVVIDRIADQSLLMEVKTQELKVKQKFVYGLHKQLLVSMKTLVINNKINDRRQIQLNKLEWKIIKQRYLRRFHTNHGKTYFIEMNRNVTWDEASTDCKSYGGYLAELDTRNAKKGLKGLKRVYEDNLRTMEIYGSSAWYKVDHYIKDSDKPRALLYGHEKHMFKYMARMYIALEGKFAIRHNRGYAIVLEILNCAFRRNNYICQVD